MSENKGKRSRPVSMIQDTQISQSKTRNTQTFHQASTLNFFGIDSSPDDDDYSLSQSDVLSKEGTSTSVIDCD